MICLKLKPKLELYSNRKGLSEALRSLLIDLGLSSVLIWLVEFVSGSQYLSRGLLNTCNWDWAGQCLPVRWRASIFRQM